MIATRAALRLMALRLAAAAFLLLATLRSTGSLELGDARGSFTLDRAANVSAALFVRGTGVLVRQLLVGVPHGPGLHSIQADRRLPTDPIDVEVRAVASSATYMWDGVIANT